MYTNLIIAVLANFSAPVVEWELQLNIVLNAKTPQEILQALKTEPAFLSRLLERCGLGKLQALMKQRPALRSAVAEALASKVVFDPAVEGYRIDLHMEYLNHLGKLSGHWTHDEGMILTESVAKIVAIASKLSKKDPKVYGRVARQSSWQKDRNGNISLPVTGADSIDLNTNDWDGSAYCADEITYRKTFDSSAASIFARNGIYDKRNQTDVRFDASLILSGANAELPRMVGTIAIVNGDIDLTEAWCTEGNNNLIIASGSIRTMSRSSVQKNVYIAGGDIVFDKLSTATDCVMIARGKVDVKYDVMLKNKDIKGEHFGDADVGEIDKLFFRPKDLGITFVVDKQLGLVVDSVAKNSSFAGKLKKGDVVRYLNGRACGKPAELLVALRTAYLADYASIIFGRQGNPLFCNVRGIKMILK